MRKDLQIELLYSAQYLIEDAAAILISHFDRTLLKEPCAVPAEQFAKFLELNIFTEYLEGDSVVVFAEEPQCVRDMRGKKIYLDKGDGIIERYNAEASVKNYNYFSMLISSLALDRIYYADKQKVLEETGQLSFNFFETQSDHKLEITIDDLERAELNEGKAAIKRAENLCGCLLMPKVNFKKAANSLFNQLDQNRNTLDNSGLDYILLKLADIFNVPRAFVFTRLHRLGYV